MTARLLLRIAHGFGNSRQGIQAALEGPVDVIEADVRWRAGRLWLGHDGRLPLLPVVFGRRPARRGIWAPRGLPLGLWQAHLDLDPLPVEDLLATVAGRRQLLLDLKGSYGPADSRRFVETLVGLLKRFDQVGGVRLCGGWPLLDEARRMAPESRVHYSIADGRRWLAFVRRLNEGHPVKGVSVHAGLLDRRTAGFLRDKGLEVFCWPVDDLGEFARLADLGVDGIISYDLALLAACGTRRGARNTGGSDRLPRATL